MASYDDPIANAAIYSDFYYDTSKYYTDSFRYRLESPLGNVLQRGEVSPKPDGTPALIYMNRICEPYLSIELDPTKTGLTSHPDASKKFWLLDDDTGTSACTYTPIRMYSGYAPWETGIGGRFIPGEKILSDPIRPNVSKEMSLPFTVFSEFGFTGSLPAPESSGGGEEGQGCGYYIYFNDQTGSTCNITVTADQQDLFLDVHTNIPYSTFPMGTLIHTHTPTGVIAAYENPDLLLLEYEDYYDSNTGHHTVYDHTDETPPKIEYKVLLNYQGRTKHYVERYYVEPPLCSTRTLIYTLNITQLP